MPFVPETLDDAGVSPGAQSLAASSPQGQPGVGGAQQGIPPEAYQLMALATMHKLGRVQGAPPRATGERRPGTKPGDKPTLRRVK